MREAIVAALARDGEWTGELIHTARDGRAIVVMSRHHLLVEPDRRRYMLETSLDITVHRHKFARREAPRGWQYDPHYRDPWLVATLLPLSPPALRALSRDRWPVEQVPLAAKPLLGAARHFVHAPQTGHSCHRLPAQ